MFATIDAWCHKKLVAVLLSNKSQIFLVFLLKTPQSIEKDFDDLGPSWQQAEPNLHQPIKNLTRGFNHSRGKELTDFDSTTNLLLYHILGLPASWIHFSFQGRRKAKLQRSRERGKFKSLFISKALLVQRNKSNWTNWRENNFFFMIHTPEIGFLSFPKFSRHDNHYEN